MSFSYGSRTYGAGLYGGRDTYGMPGALGASVMVYKPDGSVRGGFETGHGKLLQVLFGHDECGCTDFSLVFSGYVDIRKKDVVRIYVMDSDDCFFTGVVRIIPIDGSTKSEWNYSGFGLIDYLVRVNTEEKTYAGDTVDDIVRDLAVDLAARSPVNYDASKVSVIGVTVTGVNFHYLNMKDAMDQLKKFGDSDGNTYVYGVDRDGDFFFRPRSDKLMATLTVGKDGRNGIENYEPSDGTEYRTKLYVLKKDGTFWGTVSSPDDALDVYEEKVTAPDIDDADLDAWAEGTLASRNRDTREAAVVWRVWEHDPVVLVGDGNIRVISNVVSPEAVDVTDGTAYGAGTYGSGYYGGAPSYQGKDLDDLLEVREVKYSISSAGAVREVQLGALAQDITRDVRKIINKVEDMAVSLGI